MLRVFYFPGSGNKKLDYNFISSLMRLAIL